MTFGRSLKTSTLLLPLLCCLVPTLLLSQPNLPGLRLNGRFLTTPCNDTVVLRGVNKMIVWTPDLDLRKLSYAEIRKTGANCVRIVWLATPGPFEVDAGPEGLDRTLQDCIDADMIPMVELHDATGDWSKLQNMVDYWLRADVMAVIRKHEKYLIVNIANECGNETVTNEQFISGYNSAISQLRAAGIHTPLIVDAADWGKNLAQLVACGPSIMQADPDRNVMFSVHTYWALVDGADSAYFAYHFQNAVNEGLPFMVGEFTAWFNRGQTCTYEVDYKSIIQICQNMRLGYLPWEWGPGNEYNEPTCEIMNMTTDSHYATLRDTWAKVVAETSPNSIRATSITPKYIINAGVCDPTNVADVINETSRSIQVFPNPVISSTNSVVRVFAAQPAMLSLEIFSTDGRRLANIQRGYVPEGFHDIEFNIDASGIYNAVVSLVNPSQNESLIERTVFVVMR